MGPRDVMTPTTKPMQEQPIKIFVKVMLELKLESWSWMVKPGRMDLD